MFTLLKVQGKTSLGNLPVLKEISFLYLQIAISWHRHIGHPTPGMERLGSSKNKIIFVVHHSRSSLDNE
jgi:hypothetical protein